MSLLAPILRDVPRDGQGKLQGPAPLAPRVLIGLGAILLGAFISNLDTRLTTFSLNDLRGGTGLGADEASWVSVAYNVAEVAIVPLTPWLASVISQRRAVAISLVLLTIGGALVPWAANQGFTWLVALRFIQGIGGGALIPLLLGIFLRYLPFWQRAQGFALYALVTASTPLISETVAGVLTDIVGWQAVFYVGAAFGPIALFMTLVGLPAEPVKWEGFASGDYLGILLMALAASLITVGCGVGQRLDWFSAPLIRALAAGAACSLVAFVLWELVHPAPLVKLKLFGVFNFSAGLLTVFVFAFSTLMTSSVLPTFGSQVRGWRELQVGEILVWAALCQVVVCAAAPWLLRVLEARIVLAGGLLIATLGARLATWIDSDWVRAQILPSHLLQACGQPLIMIALVIIATAELQPADAISGGTLFNVIRTLAGTVGGAALGGILAVRARVHSSFIAAHLVAGAQATVSAGPLARLAGAARRQAATMAAADAYGWIGIVTLVGMLLPLAMRQTRLFRAPE